MQKILKMLLAVGVVAFSVFMTATSCDKKDPSGGSGGSGGGSDDSNLPLFLISEASSDVVKLRGNTAVVNASTFSKALGRGSLGSLFLIKYRDPDAKAVLYFVSRPHVTKDTITLKAADATSCSVTESAANALGAAAGGGHCREYDTDGRRLKYTSYLGTVFNNTKTATHARGNLVFVSAMYGFDRGGPSLGRFSIVSDATAFIGGLPMGASMRVVVNTGVTATIDEAWVNDSASTTEVELYAIAIDVTDKTIEEFSGLKKVDFDKELDNATFKKMLEKNKSADLKFKVRIVTAANF